jgi:hypothetical protein
MVIVCKPTTTSMMAYGTQHIQYLVSLQRILTGILRLARVITVIASQKSKYDYIFIHYCTKPAFVSGTLKYVSS